jgi:hypothetical protein
MGDIDFNLSEVIFHAALLGLTMEPYDVSNSFGVLDLLNILKGVHK